MAERLQPIRAGFVPLLDSAILVIAREQGFAAMEGIDLQLVRENSWANIRDRLVVGHFDVSHMLAPMPIASSLKLNPLNAPMIAPMALGLGGNAVTVSHSLWAELLAFGATADLSAVRVGAALRAYIRSTPERAKLRFGVVHPFSGHNYELRYWLAASGVHPDRDIEILVLPPSLLPDALASGAIDGFCVGAPWSSVAVGQGAGRIATVKSSIWQSSPEKVLGVTVAWAAANGELLSQLLRALYRAAEWCGSAENLEDVARILSAAHYLGHSPDVLMRGLAGQLLLGEGETASVPDFFLPHERAANFPWQSHGLWFYAQMVRWGHATHSEENARIAASCFRPDLYRAALAPMGVAVPAANSKVEGGLHGPTPVGVNKGRLLLGPDGFFDGRTFDPNELDAYIAAQKDAP